jgi:hypothetical protein
MNHTAEQESAEQELCPEAIALRNERIALDDKLSNRYIELDPQGYFIIYVDREARLICAEHFSNVINDKGLACDPETGEPLGM